MTDPYPDIEIALMEYLEPLVAPGRTVTQLMSWADGDLPAIRIARIGGGQIDEDNDGPRVQIQTFAKPTEANPRASQDLAWEVFELMKQVHGVVAGGTCMDSATKDSGPVTRFWDDPSIRVSELIYSVTVRT